MQDDEDQQTTTAPPERVENIMKELDSLAEILAAIGEDAGAGNIRLAREHLEKLRSDIK